MKFKEINDEELSALERQLLEYAPKLMTDLLRVKEVLNLNNEGNTNWFRNDYKRYLLNKLIAYKGVID